MLGLQAKMRCAMHQRVHEHLTVLLGAIDEGTIGPCRPRMLNLAAGGPEQLMETMWPSLLSRNIVQFLVNFFFAIPIEFKTQFLDPMFEVAFDYQYPNKVMWEPKLWHGSSLHGL